MREAIFECTSCPQLELVCRSVLRWLMFSCNQDWQDKVQCCVRQGMVGRFGIIWGLSNVGLDSRFLFLVCNVIESNLMAIYVTVVLFFYTSYV